jgi:uncharacterized protein involved in exopolysaccharide biosynthesis
MSTSNIPNTNRQEQETSLLNLRWVITTLLATWPWFLASISIAVISANLYLRYSIPVYKVSNEILFGDNSAKSTAKSDEIILEGLGLTTKNNDLANVMRILRSKPLMMRVVNRLRLNIQYYEYGNVKTTQFYGDVPFRVLIDDTVLTNVSGRTEYKVVFKSGNDFTLTYGNTTIKSTLGQLLHLPSGDVVLERTSKLPIYPDVKYSFVISSPMMLAGQYAGALDIARPDKAATYVNISILDEIPARGKDIIDTLVRVYAEKNVEDRNRIADNTISFITERLQNVEYDLNAIEKEIEKYKKINNLTGEVGEQTKLLMQTTGDNFKQYTETSIQLEIINDLEKYITDNQKRERLVPSTLLIDNSTLNGYIQKYNELLSKKEQLLITNTDSNPIVMSLTSQLNNMRSDMLSSIQRSKKALQIMLNELQRQGGSINAKIKEVPKLERVSLDYSRKQQIMQELFLYLLKKREETQVAKSSTVSNVTVINNAENNGAIKPNPGRIKNTALFIGFLIPILGLLLRRMLNNKVISKGDINNV